MNNHDANQEANARAAATTIQPPFVGREHDVALLAARLAAARSGAGGVVTVAGDAGIGKTRLLAQLTEQARTEGWTVLTGRAYQADGLPPYLPFVEALRDYIRELPDDVLRERLGDTAADLAVLLPDLHPRLPGLLATPAAAIERYRLFESIADFLLSVARYAPAGLLLVLDDLHWADTPSLLLAQHIARRLGGQRVLMAATYRDAEVDRGHPVSALLADVFRDPNGAQILLHGLSEQDVAHYLALTAAAAVPAALAGTVYRETEGNPLFMVELVRLLDAEGRLHQPDVSLGGHLTVPQSIIQVIGRRLDRLSSACNETLTIAAVLGREFDLLALRRVSGTDGELLLQAIEEGERARIVAASPGLPGRFSFTHPLIRETLYSQMLTTQRVRLHRQVAVALEALYAYDAEPHLAELAHHYVQSAPLGEVGKAVAFARRAGDRAMTLLAYEEAIRLYSSALQALGLQPSERESAVTRCVLMVALGEAQTRAGETAVAKATFIEAAGLATALDLPEQLCRAALGYGGYRWTPGQMDARFIALAEAALAALANQRGGLSARLRARLAMELYESDDRERRVALCDGAIEDALAAGDRSAHAAALVGRHYALHEPANLAERLTWAAELVALARSAGDREVELQGHYLHTIDLLESSDVAAAGLAIDAHDHLAQIVRQPLYTWRTELLRGTQAVFEGRFAEAGALVQGAFAIAQGAQIANGPAAYGIQLLGLRLLVGGLEVLEAPQRSMLERAPGYTVLRAGLALIYARAGRTEDARLQFETLAAKNFSDLRYNDDFFPTMASLAEACAFLQDTRRAPILYEMLAPYGDRLVVLNAAIGCIGPVARYQGLLATLLERWDAAEAHIAASLAICARTGSLPYRATTLADQAAMLAQRDAAGDREQALQVAHEALALATRLGMPPLSASLHALIDRVQLRPHEATPAGAPAAVSLPDGLTEREVEVLRLLAGGMTNREIASLLVLSSRTVDHHVATIYRKTGARRRADAAAYALRSGLLAPASAVE